MCAWPGLYSRPHPSLLKHLPRLQRPCSQFIQVNNGFCQEGVPVRTHIPVSQLLGRRVVNCSLSRRRPGAWRAGGGVRAADFSICTPLCRAPEAPVMVTARGSSNITAFWGSPGQAVIPSLSGATQLARSPGQLGAFVGHTQPHLLPATLPHV